MTGEALLRRCERKTILLAKGLRRRIMSSDGPRCYVFVAGMQRSGTNMVMDVLERSFDTDVYHESDPRAFDRYMMREPAVIRRLADESTAPLFVIKALCELDRLAELMQLFAPAKTLWVLRDWEDVVNSATRSFRALRAPIGLIAEDRNAAEWRGRGMSDATHAVVRHLYHPQMSEATAAALTWYFRNILFFERGYDRDARVGLICYESLVTNPPKVLGDVCEFIGLPYRPRMGSIVSPRSIKKDPAPSIDAEVRARCEELAGRFAARTRSVGPDRARRARG